MSSPMIIQYNRPNTTRIQGQYIVPGVNKIEAGIAKRMARDRQFRHFCERGIIIVTANAPANSNLPQPPQVRHAAEVASEETEVSSLAEMKAADAVELVGNTLNLDLLDEFEEEEKNGKARKSVLEAIESQRAELNKTEDDSGGEE